jgi:hypothetical protein
VAVLQPRGQLLASGCRQGRIGQACDDGVKANHTLPLSAETWSSCGERACAGLWLGPLRG